MTQTKEPPFLVLKEFCERHRSLSMKLKKFTEGKGHAYMNLEQGLKNSMASPGDSQVESHDC